MFNRNGAKTGINALALNGGRVSYLFSAKCIFYEFIAYICSLI